VHGSVLGFFSYGALQGREVTGRRVLEVGSLNVNGSVRPMVEARGPADYLGVDVVAGPGVDMVADAAHLADTFGLDAFDVVISTECLEHVGDWQAAIANMVAVLAPGGVLVWTTRSPGFGWHHPPDRWRYTQAAMADILRRLGLDPMVVMDDPEMPGVFVKAAKPAGWHPGTASLEPEAVARALAVTLAGVQGVTVMVEPQRWLMLPANPDGCGYYRCWQPWGQLARQSGQEALIPPPGEHLIIPTDPQVERLDLLAAQRPNGTEIARLWRRWHTMAQGPALVYEVDDLVTDPDPAALPNWLPATVRETALDCLQLADLVTCSTPFLAERLVEHTDAPVAVLPNLIHEDLLAMTRPASGHHGVTVGWAGGLSHLRDWTTITDPLQAALSGRAAELHLIGWDFSPLVRGVPARFTPFQANIWDYYQAIDFDLAVIPLADRPFGRARSWIKALELAALGVPVVAADLEPYRDMVVDGVTGYLCSTPGQWASRVRDLVCDPQARAEMGAKAREHAAAYTIQQGWDGWAAAYQVAIDRAAAR
jgi:glycosyltransferase involved in cell wall biosynthesis